MTTRLHGLPAAHPFRTGVAAQLSPHALAELAVAHRRGWSGGMSLKLVDGVEVPDDDPRPADEPEDDGSLADSEVIRIDGKDWKVGDLKKIAATEKRQGKRAGQREVLEALGVEDVDAAKKIIDAAREQQRKDETEAERKTREAEESRSTSERERAEAREEKRTAALERALVRRGVADEDLDDAVTILGKKLAADADAEAIAEEADALKTRRPELFGAEEAAPTRRPAAQIPPGRPAGRPRPKGAVFGAGGLARAEKRFGKTGADK